MIISFGLIISMLNKLYTRCKFIFKLFHVDTCTLIRLLGIKTQTMIIYTSFASGYKLQLAVSAGLTEIIDHVFYLHCFMVSVLDDIIFHELGLDGINGWSEIGVSARLGACTC